MFNNNNDIQSNSVASSHNSNKNMSYLEAVLKSNNDLSNNSQIMLSNIKHVEKVKQNHIRHLQYQLEQQSYRDKYRVISDDTMYSIDYDMHAVF